MSDKKKMPREEKIKLIFELAAIIIAVGSAVISGITLREMKHERDLTYMPEVLMNDVPETMTYFPDEEDHSEDIKWVIGANVSVSLDQYNQLSGRSEYSIRALHEKGIDSLTDLPIKNVTDGTAIDIKCKWDPENVDNLLAILSDINPVWTDSVKINPGDDFYYYGYSEEIGLDLYIQNEKDFAYLVNNDEQETTIKFPLLYSLLISRIIAENPSQELNDIIKMTMEYSDIQGNTYLREVSFDISILIRRELYDHNNSHGMLCSYLIVPKIKKIS